MSYIVSARKYRPHTFEDVVGQQQITETLKKAIESDHVAQAFLFCGPRGVGKTTCARILAKAVNTGKTEKLDEITEDFSFNIFELDAASNNKVDDIHLLMQQVRIPPQTGKYKIYIIDEVHMLSQSAFNAFLKTLEEPPPYAIFILATTEKHKILPTILSRCQIYDFKRISVNDIVAHLKRIAGEEGINVKDDALHIIAEKADGALRDALSIFDRLVSFSGQELTYEAVVKNLNVLDYDYFFKVVDALAQEDLASAMLLFNDVLNNGFEGNHFTLGLAEHLRNLLVCKEPKTLSLLEVSEALQERYKRQSAETPISFILNALSLSSECEVQYSMSQNKRLLVEVMLMKMAYAARAISGKDLASTEKKKPLASKEEEATAKAESTPEPEKEAPPAETIEETEVEVATETQVEDTPVEKATEPIEEVKEAVVKPISNGFSLDALEKQVEQELGSSSKEEVTQTIEEDEGSDTELSQDSLDHAWQVVLDELGTDAEQKSLLGIIDDKHPTFENGQIILHLDSEVERSFVTKNLLAIIGVLKQEIKLPKDGIQIEVNEVVKKRKHILNNKDKFELMLKKNPAIKDLKDQLGLELEL